MKYGLSELKLEEVVSVLYRHKEIEIALLFSSRAKDSFKEDSDVDTIAIKGEKVNQALANKLKFYVKEKTGLPFFFDFLSYKDIDNKNLKKHIDKQGIVIYRKGWRTVKLGEICSKINYGYTANAQSKQIGPKFLRITDIVSDTINWVNVPYCEISSDKVSKYKLKKGDIVIARTGATTGFNKIIKNEIESVFASYLIRYRVNINTAYPFFVWYVLQSSYWKIFVKSIIGGSAQPGANAKQFANFEVSLPPLQEQKAIAEVLSSLDDKIELLHEQNKTLEAIAQTLFRKWFIEEANPDWKKQPLSEILDTIESGSRPKGGIDPELKQGIPSIGAESINGIGRFNFSKVKYITDNFFRKMKRGIIKNYDILIYKDGAYIGKKAMFGNDFPFKEMAVNEHVFILRTNNIANQFFLYFSLEQQKLSKLNANSAQPGLNQQAMKSLEIIIPPKDMMNYFGSTVKPWIDKILFNGQQIRKLKTLGKTLLPKLISGQVRVKH